MCTPGSENHWYLVCTTHTQQKKKKTPRSEIHTHLKAVRGGHGADQNGHRRHVVRREERQTQVDREGCWEADDEQPGQRLAVGVPGSPPGQGGDDVKHAFVLVFDEK